MNDQLKTLTKRRKTIADEYEAAAGREEQARTAYIEDGGDRQAILAAKAEADSLKATLKDLDGRIQTLRREIAQAEAASEEEAQLRALVALTQDAEAQVDAYQRHFHELADALETHLGGMTEALEAWTQAAQELTAALKEARPEWRDLLGRRYSNQIDWLEEAAPLREELAERGADLVAALHPQMKQRSDLRLQVRFHVDPWTYEPGTAEALADALFQEHATELACVCRHGGG